MEVAGLSDTLPFLDLTDQSGKKAAEREKLAKAKANKEKPSYFRPRAPDDDESEATMMDLEGNVAYGAAGNADRKPHVEDVVEPLKAEEVKEVQDMVGKLMEMTEVQRADLIEELTRKAFVLMEAGEVKEATEYLNRASKVGSAFQQIMAEVAVETKSQRRKVAEDEEDDSPISAEERVALKFRQDLHKDDFRRIFGGEARFASLIGGF